MKRKFKNVPEALAQLEAVRQELKTLSEEQPRLILSVSGLEIFTKALNGHLEEIRSAMTDILNRADYNGAQLQHLGKVISKISAVVDTEEERV